MNKNFQISLIVLFSFILSISFLIGFLHDLEPQLVPLEFQENFYSQNFDPKEKKIFLIGSSEVHRLNATFIENYISQHVDDYTVYNLGIHADLPNRRIASIDYIISSNPEIIVYGTGFREYHVPRNIENFNTFSNSYLPTLPQMFQLFEIIDSNIAYDFSKLESPKIHILRFIRDSFIDRNPEVTLDMLKTNTPFMKYDQTMYSISTNKELELFYQHPVNGEWPGIKNPDSDNASYALNELISIFKQNNIEVILFSNPSNSYELEMIGNNDVNIFVENLQNISEKNNIKVNFLHEKYANSSIFSHGNHVSMNKSGLIYSEDIAKIILKEIEN